MPYSEKVMTFLDYIQKKFDGLKKNCLAQQIFLLYAN